MFLRPVHSDETLDPLAGMKPERRPEMGEVERSWGRDGRQEVGLAKIQRQIPQHKETRILFHALDAGLGPLRLERAFFANRIRFRLVSRTR